MKGLIVTQPVDKLILLSNDVVGLVGEGCMTVFGTFPKSTS